MSGAAGALAFYCQIHACYLDQFVPWIIVILLGLLIIGWIYRRLKKKKLKKSMNIIRSTPILKGKDAERFIKLHESPLSKRDIEVLDKCVDSYRKNKENWKV